MSRAGKTDHCAGGGVAAPSSPPQASPRLGTCAQHREHSEAGGLSANENTVMNC